MDSLRPGAINQMSTEDLHRAPNREPALSFKSLAEALVEFRKVLVDGGVEESHALMMTRDWLGIMGPEYAEKLANPPMIHYPPTGWDYQNHQAKIQEMIDRIYKQPDVVPLGREMVVGPR